MPRYDYTARGADGKKITGSADAPDVATLQIRLSGRGQYLIESREQKRALGKQLKTAMLVDFCRQLGALLEAGISAPRSIDILEHETGLKPKQKAVYSFLLRVLRRGEPLSDAMENSGVFPALAVNMIRASETNGRLESSVKELAVHYEKAGKLKSKISSATLYPKILSVLIVAVVAIIMGYVMPQFDELFSAMPTMPIATRILFAISDFVAAYWWAIGIIAVVLSVVGRTLIRMPVVRLGWDRLILQVPGIKNLLKIIYTARFSRTLSSLYSCGISIVNALAICKNTVGNSYISSQFPALIAAVRGGAPLSETLLQVDGFTQKLSAMVKVGEESGRLDSMLNNIASDYEYESELALNKLVTYAEPVMIIIMAVIVGFIMFAVLLPIIDSYQYIGA